MPQEIKNSIIVNVATWLLIGMIAGFGTLMHNEWQDYRELKILMPQIRDLNKVREEMEAEYKENKKYVSGQLWLIKQDLKNLKKLRAKDSTYIYWSYSNVYNWVYGTER